LSAPTRRAWERDGPRLATTHPRLRRRDRFTNARLAAQFEVATTVVRLYLVRMLQRTLPAGFVAPCLPTKTEKLPSGSQWLHEIKHDGFRVIARKKGAQVRLYGCPCNHLTPRFPLIVDALARNGGRMGPLRCWDSAKLARSWTRAAMEAG